MPSTNYEYEIIDEIQSEQAVVIYLDLLVGIDGSVVELKLSEGQVNRGIFSEAAIRKIKQTKHEVKIIDGKAKSYWKRNLPFKAGSVIATGN